MPYRGRDRPRGRHGWRHDSRQKWRCYFDERKACRVARTFAREYPRAPLRGADLTGRAHEGKAARFQHAEQSGLTRSGELPDLVQKHGAAARFFENPGARSVSAGEGAALVAKQGALDQVGGIAAQFRARRGPLLRKLAPCSSRAASSLPVPVSPSKSTDKSVLALGVENPARWFQSLVPGLSDWGFTMSWRSTRAAAPRFPADPAPRLPGWRRSLPAVRLRLRRFSGLAPARGRPRS